MNSVQRPSVEMRKEVRAPSTSQRVSRSVGKKQVPVQKAVKRAASTNLKQEVKKRKTNNSSGILIGGLEEVSCSRREPSSHAEQSVKAKKKIVAVKVTSRKVIGKKPVQVVKGKKLRIKNDSIKVAAKPKQKNVVNLSGKKTLKLNTGKNSSASAADKGPKDGKTSGKKSIDKMGKAVGKKTPDTSPDRRVSEAQTDNEPHKKQNKSKTTTTKTVTSTKISKISNIKKEEKSVKKPLKKDNQKVKEKSGTTEETNKSANCESKVTTKKGVLGRRKSTNKSEKSLESSPSPSQSPSRETSPLKSKSSDKILEKPTLKGKRPEKKATKEKDQSKPQKAEVEKSAVTEIQNTPSDVCSNATLETAGTDDVRKKQPSTKEDNIRSSKESTKLVKVDIKLEEKICDQKTQLDIKCMPPKKLIKQKVEIEHEMKVKKVKQSEEDLIDNIKLETQDDVNNDSSTSDEIPLNEILKRSILKQETDLKSGGELKTSNKLSSECISGSLKLNEDKRHQSSADENEENSVLQDSIPIEKASNVKSKRETVPEKKLTKCVKDDQPKKKPEKNGNKDLKLKKEIKSTLKSKESTEKKAVKQKVAKLVKKSKLGEVRNRQKRCNVQNNKSSDKSDSDSRGKRLKLFGYWNGPKRHRVASLNALAKVHCLYENESRTALLEMCDSSSSNTTQSYSNKTQPKKTEEKPKESIDPPVPTHTRTLRSAPGLRAPGRHWDMLNVSTTSTSTTSEDSSDTVEDKKLTLQPSVKQKQNKKPENDPSSCSSEEENKAASKTTKTEEDSTTGNKKVKKKRKRHELMMDLKDMVVRKRMASLNASAILAASYSVEKRPVTKKDDGGDEDQKEKREKKREAAERRNAKKRAVESSPDMEVEESSGDDDVIVRSTNGKSKQKVAVIVNQDTDVTITGVYVNSTTRSTHHEGYCSIAGMQYRISSTSHTQTEATAVATETVLHAEHVSTHLFKYYQFQCTEVGV